MSDGFSDLGPAPTGIEYSKVDPTMYGPEEIKNRFGFHKATIEGPEATQPKHAALREAFENFANMLDQITSHSREKSLSFTHLEDAAMWAHKAIAKTAPLDTGK